MPLCYVSQKVFFKCVALDVFYGSPPSVFLSVYGFVPDQATSSVISANGDDSYAIILASDSSIVDLYGDVSVDGSGNYADGTETSWEFEDGRAERKASSTTPSSSTA